MIDPVTQGLLQELVSRQSRSLLRYVGDSFPWSAAGKEHALANLHQIVAEDQEATKALIRFLQRARIVVPFQGSYPSWFTTINFVSLDYLLPMLIRDQRAGIADLETALPQVANQEAQDQLRRLLDVRRKHLRALEAPAESAPLQTAAH